MSADFQASPPPSGSVIPPALSVAEGTGAADFLLHSRCANIGHGEEGPQ